ncbi:MAG: DUF5597 domain-containing protein [Oscillospiraceae bacterium]|nr:DUF5597 domain-containing protein [Oscillospiraceae bacterium]
MSLPAVKRDEKGIPTLYVHDRPFFMRSGEIHNSSASDPVFLEEKLWPALRGLNMNSVIVPLYWELLEPEEGRYDFSIPETIVSSARREGLKLCFLWFGLWKNAESMYVPAWMKKDTETYFRAEKVSGEKMPTVSPLCAAAVEKDRQAFTALMRRIREIDSEENTVVVMQVENEIGLLGTDRDYSSAANKAFHAPIPEKLSAAVGKSGTWEEVFGEDAAESFMAWHFASAVETIAASGKREYDLPCYANAWLRQSPWFPGSYPSGGPVRQMHPIWKAAAPSLFALGPDIYVPYCADVMDEYADEGNPLFIPEIRKDAVASSYALYAFGRKNAICFSPFGIEDLALDPGQLDKPPMELMIALNIDPSAFDITGSKDCLSATYGMLKELEPLYLEHRGTRRLQSCVRHGENDYSAFLRFENCDLVVKYGPRMSGKPLGACQVYELAPDRFLVIGLNCTPEFRVKPGTDRKMDILRMEEGRVADGRWIGGRIFNGDEKMNLRFGDMPTALLVELYSY